MDTNFIDGLTNYHNSKAEKKLHMIKLHAARVNKEHDDRLGRIAKLQAQKTELDEQGKHLVGLGGVYDEH